MAIGWRWWMAVACFASAWLGNAAATSPRGPSTGPLPASFEGTIPGADSPVSWNLDLLPEGRWQVQGSHPELLDEAGAAGGHRAALNRHAAQ